MARSFPKDWFNLPQDMLADFGAMMFLAALSKTHNAHSLGQNFYGFETPLRLKQYYIFRNRDGYPRGFVTFAGLSPDAEMRFAVEQTALKPEDWCSGSSFWIVDFIMPFGQTQKVVDKLKSDLPYNRVRTNRLASDMTTARIVEWFRRDDQSVGLKTYRKGDFAALLGAA
ncbi:MAG: toxin-activating lysine-acyltransferase [Pseudomonadota bacterium]